MLVNIDGTMYEDGVNLTHEAFYSNLPNYKEVPKTAAQDVLEQRLFAYNAHRRIV